MKKIFTLIAAAIMAVGAYAQTPITYGGQGDGGSWSWGFDQEFNNGEVSLMATGGYGRFDVCKGVTPTSGQTIVVDVESITGAHQLSWKEAGTEMYSGTLKEGENSITFGEGEISDVNILGPATPGDKDVIVIKSVKLEGEQTTYEAKWSYGILASKITQTGQWNEIYLNKVNVYKDLSLTINTKSDIPEFFGEGDDNSVKHGFQLKVKYDEGSETYLPIQGGDGIKSVTIHVGENVKEISIQALNGGAVDNESLDIESIYASDSNSGNDPDDPEGDGDDMEGYKDPVDITSAMDEWGNIESKTFNGFSDDAVVVFTWNSTGSDVKINWGAGSLSSIAMEETEDGKKPVVDLGEGFSIKQEGENKVQKTIAELKEALNAGPDQYGRYGLYWNMWPFDGCSNERVSVKVYEVEGFEGEGYVAPVASAIKTVSTVNVKVAKVLKNGQIIISNNGNEFNVAGQLVK